MRILVVAILLACAVMPARAESIVFVGNDPELVDALGTVISEVKAIGDRPTPSLADLGPESRRLADEQHASATVWLSPTVNGATLVTYDRSADRFVVREVPYKLPLETTQAFETARMVRVMLRAIAERNDEAAVTKRLPMPRGEPAGPLATASIGGGAWFAAPEAAATPMTAVAVAWRPWGLGAAATAMLAASTDIASGTVTGDVQVWRLALEARYAIQLSRALRLTPGAGMSLHSVDLELGGSEMLTSHRYNPGVLLSTTLGITLPHRFEAALALSADCLLQRQRYAAGTQEVLVVPRIQAALAILIGVRL